jgi:glyoxylase-like metal-dependent hydrolase (beta-lactamase superfamily II)
MKPLESAEFGPVTVYFGEKSGKYPDGNQVIVRGSDTLAIFDTPQVANHVGSDVDEADLVILGHMHEDHAAGLHRVPSAAVYAHHADVDAVRSWNGLARHYGYPPAVLADLKTKIEADFQYVPRPDAIGYPDEKTWELGGVTVRAIHMPGHTSGHSVLFVEQHGIAFIGDIDLSSFGPYYGDASSSLAEFRRSLDLVARLPARVWITSHHKGVVTDRETFLAALRAFAARIDAREARLLELLAGQPRSLEELVACRVMYPPQAAELWIDCAERRCIEQHLAELHEGGRIRMHDDQRYTLS